ncbi:MAG: T9SS type A sorting domain-containing protein [Saprospiraceae bacterium]|nr:T9SS type A sorting domain-containing protein [Saprospiraceae bacterium]
MRYHRLTLSLIVCLTLVIKMNSQCVPPAADNCDETPVLCSLDGVNGYTCMNTDYSNPTGCSPLCPTGAVAHNTSWWAFVTDGGNVCVTITFSNCTVNGTGVEFGIWGDCNCGQSIFCDRNCNGPGKKTACGNLEPCKTYYLFVDGCTGDVCNFTINTSGGSAPMLPPLGNLTGPTSLCKNACNVKYSIDLLGGGACAPAWQWTLDGVEIPDQYNKDIFLDFPDEGDFTLCVTAIIGNPQSGFICDQEGPKCLNIRVNDKKIHKDIRNICYSDLPYNWNGIIIDSAGEYTLQFKESTSCCLIDSIVRFNFIYNDSVGCKSSNYIEGKVFLDQNKDNLFNSGESYLKDYLIVSTPANYATFSQLNGYTLRVKPFALNQIKIFLQNPNKTVAVPVDYNINVNNTYGKFNGSFDFAIQSDDYIDFESQLHCSRARSGRNMFVTLRVNNVGTITSAPEFITLEYPQNWILNKSFTTPTSHIGNLIKWTKLSILSPQSYQNIILEFFVPPGLSLGNKFEFIGFVNHSFDIPIQNNSSKCIDSIRGSYDPNDKQASLQQIQFVEGEYKDLIYTIRFQNTGNDTAFDIHIRDTIPLTLDPTTIRVVNASHLYKLEMPKLREFVVHFKNILLPDSTTDRIGSNGFVQLAIKPKNTLEVGSQIFNTASIYFDFNEPVRTNTAFSQIVKNITQNEDEANLFNIYPNPFKEEIIVQLTNNNPKVIDQAEIIDLDGNLILESKVNSKLFHLKLPAHHSGAYILILKSKGKIILNKRLIKE